MDLKAEVGQIRQILTWIKGSGIGLGIVHGGSPPYDKMVGIGKS
jgi:hypothetical protein